MFVPFLPNVLDVLAMICWGWPWVAIGVQQPEPSASASDGSEVFSIILPASQTQCLLYLDSLSARARHHSHVKACGSGAAASCDPGSCCMGLALS